MVISAGVMFFGGLGFFVSARWIRFPTQKHVPMWTAESLANAANNVFYFHNTHGFQVSTCIADDEFECLHPHISSGINLNTPHIMNMMQKSNSSFTTLMTIFRWSRAPSLSNGYQAEWSLN